MEIVAFVPARISQPAFDKAVMDAPLPPEMPTAVHAGFSLVQLLDRSAKALNRNLEIMLKCPVDVSVEQLQAKQIRSQMWAQQLQQCGRVFTHCRETLPMEQRQRLNDEQSRILGELKEMPVPAEIADSFNAEAN